MDADFELESDILMQEGPLPTNTGYPISMSNLLPSQHKTTELLAHLASYSELMVTVSGPDGSGKSVIAQALAALREEPEDCLFINGDLMLGMPAILAAIAERWNLSRLPDDLVAAREMVRSAAIEKADDGYSLLVIIDQAEQLDAATLNDIAHFALTVPQMIAFSLFGLSGFENQIRENPANAPLHKIELEPLSLDDAALLLQQVLSPQQPLPFTQDELLALYEQSSGLPGALIHLAQDFLLQSVPVDIEPATKSALMQKGRFPVAHILAITAVAAALVMSFLYRGGSDDAESAISPVAVQPPREAQLPSAVSEPTEPETAVAEPALSSFEGETAEIQPPVVAAGPDYNYVADAKAPSEPVTEAPEVTASALPAEVAPAEKPVAPVPVAQEARASAKHSASEKVLLAVKSGFIVQLFGSYKAESAAAFRKEWQDKVTGSMYQYQTEHSGKPWHVVVAGVYSTRAEAQAAVNALPRELRKQSPWIRDIKAVQDVLR